MSETRRAHSDAAINETTNGAGTTNKVKDEPVENEEPENEPSASAGDKRDRSQTPEDNRKRLKTETDEITEIKEEDDSLSDTTPVVLEKGIIYFFFRTRVSVEEPQSIDDVARTYIVLKPQATDADGQTTKQRDKDKSSGHCRLLVLPKKILPRTGRDRYLAWVLKADASYAELDREFLAGGEDDGQDSTRETFFPPATAVGEGVYEIISTARESHLAYVLTVPEQPGPVQSQLGVADKQGCFIVSTKNPAFPMPGGAKMIGGGPTYSQDIRESFRSRRWAPLRPEHLDYVHSHILLVGESKGVNHLFADDHGGHELSAELEELADDDIDRMRRLGSTEAEAVFASLHAKNRAQGQPGLASTFAASS